MLYKANQTSINFSLFDAAIFAVLYHALEIIDELNSKLRFKMIPVKT